MSAINDGGPAFPFTPVPQPRNSDGTWIQDWDAGNPGMSLRAWLAGMEKLTDWDNPDAVISKQIS